MSSTREKKTEKVTLRITPSQKMKLEERAAHYGMGTSTYIADYVCKGKERYRFTKRKLYTGLVGVSSTIDEIYNVIMQEPSDTIPKTDIMPLIDKAKKGCDDLWIH